MILHLREAITTLWSSLTLTLSLPVSRLSSAGADDLFWLEFSAESSSCLQVAIVEQLRTCTTLHTRRAHLRGLATSAYGGLVPMENAHGQGEPPLCPVGRNILRCVPLLVSRSSRPFIIICIPCAEAAAFERAYVVLAGFFHIRDTLYARKAPVLHKTRK